MEIRWLFQDIAFDWMRLSSGSRLGLGETGEDLPQQLFVNFRHEQLFVFVSGRFLIELGAGLRVPVRYGWEDRFGVNFIQIFPVILNPALTVVMTAEIGKDQAFLPFQGDEAITEGKIIFTAITDPQLAKVGALALRLLVQGIDLQGGDDLLRPFRGNTFTFAGLDHGRQTFNKAPGLMDFERSCWHDRWSRR